MGAGREALLEVSDDAYNRMREYHIYWAPRLMEAFKKFNVEAKTEGVYHQFERRSRRFYSYTVVTSCRRREVFYYSYGHSWANVCAFALRAAVSSTRGFFKTKYLGITTRWELRWEENDFQARSDVLGMVRGKTLEEVHDQALAAMRYVFGVEIR